MYIAIDIGGSHIRTATSINISNPRIDSVHRFETQNNYDRDIQQIVQHIHSLAGNEQIEGIGCCFAGPISAAKDTILASPNLSDWIGKSFLQDLKSAFACRVELENDAACAALGEATYGLGKGRDFLFLIWGTGFGGAAVRHVQERIEVEPMEPGHSIVIWENGRECGCGQTGCLEAYVGGSNIAKYFGKPARDLTEVEWDLTYGHLAHGIIDTITIRHTSLVVFGGGIAIHQRRRFSKIEEIVRSRIKIYSAPTIQVTNFGDDVGLLGGFALLTQ